MAIYEITTSGDETKRYVEAPSAAAALSHVAGEYFKVEPVKAAGLRRLLVDGVKVETLPKAEKAAGGGEGGVAQPTTP